MKTIKLSSASRPLAAYARELGKDILVLTQGNKPVAAIVPLKHADRESLALSGHPEFLELIRKARAEFSAGKTLSLEEMRRMVQAPRKPRTKGKRGRAHAPK